MEGLIARENDKNHITRQNIPLKQAEFETLTKAFRKPEATCALQRPATVNGDIALLYNTLDLGKDQQLETPQLERPRCKWQHCAKAIPGNTSFTAVEV